MVRWYINLVSDMDSNFFVWLPFYKIEGPVWSTSLSPEVKERVLDSAMGATYILNEVI